MIEIECMRVVAAADLDWLRSVIDDLDWRRSVIDDLREGRDEQLA
ncbi:hypothetical protein [Microtetraspora malaysiensis]